MEKKWTIAVAFSVVVLIAVAITVGLVIGLRTREPTPDLSGSIIYSNAKEIELMNINGVRVFGVKDFSGNVQAVHAIQTTNVTYILDNDLLIQIQSDQNALIFNYNETSSQYYAVIISENSSYEIPSLYNIPTVKFPEVEFKLPIDANMSDPFTGVVIELTDSVSQQLISDASLQLNYYDEQYGNRSAVMINVGAGRYYAMLPTGDAEMDKYFEPKRLHTTISEQSNALIELIQAYPINDICSKVPQWTKPFCDGVSKDMNAELPDALRTASKYASSAPLESESSISVKSHFETVISMPGERAIIESLDDVSIDPNVLTIVSRKAKPSKGKCNEKMVAGNNVPDSQVINIGKGHIAIKFYYETFTVKDQIDVYYTNELVFSSGCVGTEGERVTTIRLDDNETNLRVNVTPNCAGDTSTAWNYRTQCPNQDLLCESNLCYCDSTQKPSRQVKEPTVDGCGTHRTKWNYGYIHYVGEKWNFTPFCDKHDICYGTCNTDRKVCDKTFCSELFGICKINWGHLIYMYNECLKQAGNFCTVVSFFGSGAFKDAQNEDCWCDVNYD